MNKLPYISKPKGFVECFKLSLACYPTRNKLHHLQYVCNVVCYMMQTTNTPLMTTHVPLDCKGTFVKTALGPVDMASHRLGRVYVLLFIHTLNRLRKLQVVGMPVLVKEHSTPSTGALREHSHKRFSNCDASYHTAGERDPGYEIPRVAGGAPAGVGRATLAAAGVLVGGTGQHGGHNHHVPLSVDVPAHQQIRRRTRPPNTHQPIPRLEITIHAVRPGDALESGPCLWWT